jgi:cobalt-precorrin-5B (C1)-methyltransferase
LDAGLSLQQLRLLRHAPSVEQAFKELAAVNPAMAEQLGQQLALAVEQRSQAYVARYGDWPMRIGAVLFDRNRHLRWRGPVAGERFFTLMD